MKNAICTSKKKNIGGKKKKLFLNNVSKCHNFTLESLMIAEGKQNNVQKKIKCNSCFRNKSKTGKKEKNALK